MSRLSFTTRFRAGLAASVAITTAVAAAFSAGPAVAATPNPHLAAGDVNAAWMFPAKNWSPSNEQAGRVDDMLRIGNRVYIAGNFTMSRTTAVPSRPAPTSPPRTRTPARCST